jgi:hypothetical protein
MAHAKHGGRRPRSADGGSAAQPGNEVRVVIETDREIQRKAIGKSAKTVLRPRRVTPSADVTSSDLHLRLGGAALQQAQCMVQRCNLRVGSSAGYFSKNARGGVPQLFRSMFSDKPASYYPV